MSGRRSRIRYLSVFRSGFGLFDLAEISQRAVEFALEMLDSQEAFDPRGQFEAVDGFCYEIVGSAFHAPLNVGKFVQCGHHYYGYVACCGV